MSSKPRCRSVLDLKQCQVSDALNSAVGLMSPQEVREHLHPLLLKIKEQQLPTDKGISFLELKFHLLLNYCINIAFYLYMKAEGMASVLDNRSRTRLPELSVSLFKADLSKITPSCSIWFNYVW